MIILRPTTGGRRGSAVLVLIALLGVMLMYIAANAVALHYLKQEILLMERKQTRAREQRLKTLKNESATRRITADGQRGND